MWQNFKKQVPFKEFERGNEKNDEKWICPVKKDQNKQVFGDVTVNANKR